MYWYAHLDEQDIVVDLYSFPIIVDDPQLILIPEYDESLIGKQYNRETGAFEDPEVDLEALIGKVAGDLKDHIADTQNPHAVTKDQLGLGQVDNTSDLDKPLSTAASLAIKAAHDKAEEAYELASAGGGGKQGYFTFVVGSEEGGHTASDVDYLCDGTADEMEINAAIQALPVEGGRILVLEGTYEITAPIRVERDNVTLAGAGRNTKLIRAFASDDLDDALIFCNASDVTVRDFSLDGRRDYFPEEEYPDMENPGIALLGICNEAIGNTCSNGVYGIFVSGESPKLIGNTCKENSKSGLYLSGVELCEIRENTLQYNLDGIQVSSAYKSSITNNTCIANSGNGIHLVENFSNGSVTSNLLNDNAQCGLLMDNCLESIIANNNVNTAPSGISATNCTNNVVSGNTFYNSQYGILFDQCLRNSFVGNASQNTIYGIRLTNCGECLVVANSCLGGEAPIFVDGEENVVEANLTTGGQ